jgi:hypothetical protein
VIEDKGQAGDRLGDGWLRPAPFRRLERDGNKIVVATKKP